MDAIEEILQLMETYGARYVKDYAKRMRTALSAKMQGIVEPMEKARDLIRDFSNHKCDSLHSVGNMQKSCGDVCCGLRQLCEAKSALSDAIDGIKAANYFTNTNKE